MKSKVIHYCWFGYGKKNKLIKKCIKSWKKYLPDYEIIEWNESSFDINQNEYIKEAYEQKKWAFVSDYARLWIIYNCGGIYMDTDVEIIKKFPIDIFEHKGFFCLEKNMVATGLGFGAQKHDPIIKQLLESYNNLSFNPNITCVMLNKKIFEENFENINNIKEKKIIKDYIFFPSEYFCPLDYETRKMKRTENTIAIHWYGASWQSKKIRFLSKIKFLIKIIIGEKLYEKIKEVKKKNI